MTQIVLQTGIGPVLQGTGPIVDTSWPVDDCSSDSTIFEIAAEKTMSFITTLHTALEQFQATCSPLVGNIVRKNYDRTHAAFAGDGPI